MRKTQYSEVAGRRVLAGPRVRRGPADARLRVAVLVFLVAEASRCIVTQSRHPLDMDRLALNLPAYGHGNQIVARADQRSRPTATAATTRRIAAAWYPDQLEDFPHERRVDRSLATRGTGPTPSATTARGSARGSVRCAGTSRSSLTRRW